MFHPFGQPHWDGSRSFIEVRQSFGDGVCLDGKDVYNKWRSGDALATGVMVSNLDAQGCREAAAALLQAAELLDKLEAKTSR